MFKDSSMVGDMLPRLNLHPSTIIATNPNTCSNSLMIKCVVDLRFLVNCDKIYN